MVANWAQSSKPPTWSCWGLTSISLTLKGCQSQREKALWGHSLKRFSGNCSHTNFENVILWVWLNRASSLLLKKSVSWVASCRRPGTVAAYPFLWTKIKALGWSKQRKIHNKTLLPSLQFNMCTWTATMKIRKSPQHRRPHLQMETLVEKSHMIIALCKESSWILELIFKYFIGKCQLARNELHRFLN